MTATSTPISLQEGIIAFGKGFTFTRSFTHPYELVRVGPVWVLRDGLRKNGDERAREILVTGLKPEEAVSHIDIAADGRRFFLCAIEGLGTDFASLAEAYKGLGYRLMRREPMMVRSLEEVEAVEGPFPITRVRDGELAAQVASAAGSRLILEEHLARDDAPLRLYVARDGDQLAGWVRSVKTGPRNAWAASMMVRPQYRRRGVARSLMTHMLAEDARLGYQNSVLLASQAGAKLYESVGYRQIGLLQLFAPKKA
jgi:GNAT superfamily N-acetyltransferase